MIFYSYYATCKTTSCFFCKTRLYISTSFQIYVVCVRSIVMGGSRWSLIDQEINQKNEIICW